MFALLCKTKLDSPLKPISVQTGQYESQSEPEPEPEPEPERTIPISQRTPRTPQIDNNDLLSILTEFNKNLKVPKMNIEDVKILSDEFQNLMKMDITADNHRCYRDTGDKLYLHKKDRDGNITGWNYKYMVHGYAYNYIDERYKSRPTDERRKIRDMAQKIMDKFRKKFQRTKI